MSDDFEYMSGFGNEFASEAMPDTLPQGRNTPQQVAHGLYTEQLTGSAFTAPKASNKRSWLYRIRPSVQQGAFTPMPHDTLKSAPFNAQAANPNPLRWDPLPAVEKKQDFIDGLWTVAGNGCTDSWNGLAVHLYRANQSMADTKRYFYNADGEFLIVPQQGRLILRTEMGVMDVGSNEIAVIPRGIKFAVDLAGDLAHGCVCENYGQPFILPERGPIGANGLANERDFLAPVAAFEDEEGAFTLISKFCGNLWQADLDHSPLDVVAWHGNYTPYKYDLTRFNVVNTVSFDHLDPSVFTVLTSPSGLAGTANVDFVIFPPRWLVAENTFRPPYFHRNIMSEFMGLIGGVYEGKEGGGFKPGGSSLHNCMSGHGPDAKTYLRGIEEDQKPIYLSGAMAFMFESRYVMRPTEQAMQSDRLQSGYQDTWKDLPKNFKA